MEVNVNIKDKEEILLVISGLRVTLGDMTEAIGQLTDILTEIHQYDLEGDIYAEQEGSK